MGMVQEKNRRNRVNSCRSEALGKKGVTRCAQREGWLWKVIREKCVVQLFSKVEFYLNLDN